MTRVRAFFTGVLEGFIFGSLIFGPGVMLSLLVFAIVKLTVAS